MAYSWQDYKNAGLSTWAVDKAHGLGGEDGIYADYWIDPQNIKVVEGYDDNLLDYEAMVPLVAEQWKGIHGQYMEEPEEGFMDKQSRSLGRALQRPGSRDGHSNRVREFMKEYVPSQMRPQLVNQLGGDPTDVTKYDMYGEGTPESNYTDMVKNMQRWEGQKNRADQMVNEYMVGYGDLHDEMAERGETFNQLVKKAIEDVDLDSWRKEATNALLGGRTAGDLVSKDNRAKYGGKPVREGRSRYTAE